jgi:hypothetical protein
MSQDNPLITSPTPVARQELNSSLEHAREQILALQRKKDELERAKGELEEQRRRHDEFSRGRSEIIEALNRGLIVLEHEQVETQRMLDLIAKTRDIFKEQVVQIDALSDAGWTSDNLKTELSKALATIETARMEFNRACLRIDALQGKTPENLPPSPLQQLSGPSHWLEKISFGRALKLGFSFTLPLIIIAIVVLLAQFLKH